MRSYFANIWRALIRKPYVRVYETVTYIPEDQLSPRGSQNRVRELTQMKSDIVKELKVSVAYREQNLVSNRNTPIVPV